MRLQGANKRSVEDAAPYVASIGKICFLNAPPRAALHIYYLLFILYYLKKGHFFPCNATKSPPNATKSPA